MDSGRRRVYWRSIYQLSIREVGKMTVKEYTKGQKVRLSPHFSSTEFDCSCNYSTCAKTLISDSLIHMLEQLRTAVGTPIHINSGYRCERHNAKIGGEPHSQHVLGKAADISRSDKALWSESERLFAEEVCKNGGLGLYSTPGGRYLFFHIDCRGGVVRWQVKI